MPGFLALTDVSSEDLVRLLDRADVLAEAWRQNRMPPILRDKQVDLWFYGQGFRNRIAFEIGARSMGASVSYIPGDLGVHEPLEDIGAYLDNWFSLLVVRTPNHDDLLYLSQSMAAPVVNARTGFNHPCEFLGDLQFIRKHRGSLDGLNVVFVGEVTNLCMSWFETAVVLPIQVTQVAPEGYQADQDLLDRLNTQATGEIRTSTGLDDLLPTADLVYTDCWPKTNTAANAARIRDLFSPYQITGRRLRLLSNDALFLPCPPVTRGQEVSSDAMKADQCQNYPAKAYLLHSQNAIPEYVSRL